jgi:hypothetical protein
LYLSIAEVIAWFTKDYFIIFNSVIAHGHTLACLHLDLVVLDTSWTDGQASVDIFNFGSVCVVSAFPNETIVRFFVVVVVR